MKPVVPFLALTVTAALSACSPGVPSMIGTMPADPMDRAPVTPQPALLTAKERLVAGIEANGCELNMNNVSNVLTDATISQQELVSLTPQLEAEGRVEVSGSGAIRVISDRCI